MKTILQYIHEIMHGRIIIPAKRKFVALIAGMSLVHFIYCLLFAYYDIRPLYVYNMGATAFYLFGTYWAYKEYYSVLFHSCVIEICLHALLTSWLIGYAGGFSLFLIIVTPIAFYLAFSLSAFRRRIFTPCFAAVCTFLFCLLTRALSGISPNYFSSRIPSRDMTCIYFMNAAITFFVLVFFSLLFVLEIQVGQSRLEQRNLYLDSIAHLDFLTKLLTRRRMQEYLEDALSSALTAHKSFCLVLCDIDDFKKINDTYGHDCGDQVLVHISEIFRDTVKTGDKICRWGGEEILLLLPGTFEDACQKAEHLRQQVATTPTLYGEDKISHTITLGVVSYAPDHSLTEMIRLADENLYKGKQNGKNVVIY